MLKDEASHCSMSQPHRNHSVPETLHMLLHNIFATTAERCFTSPRTSKQAFLNFPKRNMWLPIHLNDVFSHIYILWCSLLPYKNRHEVFERPVHSVLWQWLSAAPQGCTSFPSCFTYNLKVKDPESKQGQQKEILILEGFVDLILRSPILDA